ncbi:RAMP superfamily CRISPR-associated protein [Pseudoalteromonas rubra]|uniref:RAMP superfamily CRISPR-associated protein n=1 Tax=Pseudoalteromonas rubra TaxID=43658 RepID=UPI000F772F7F|nr:RAMP superfamily CRISPR-associated protein [Pseudoalteromonas rubra]
MHYILARLLVTNSSPLAINSGGRETSYDTQLARDANGFPYLPGTSIAGVWRHLAEGLDSTKLNNSVEHYFGSCDGRSRLTISHGTVLDEHGQPLPPLQCYGQPTKESDAVQATRPLTPYLSMLRSARPFHRERVAINDRAVARGNAKFDQLLLPTGVRFVLTLKLEVRDLATLPAYRSDFVQLLTLWQQRQFALGSSTRNGLGQMQILGLDTLVLDLHHTDTHNPAKQLAQFVQAAPPAKTAQPLADIQAWPEVSKLLSPPEPLCTLALQGQSYWRFGKGIARLQANTDDGREPHTLCYSEPQVNWDSGQAELSGEQVVLCGSAIKGVLAHRVAFHYQRRCEVFAEDRAQDSHADWQARPQQVNALFGYLDVQAPEQSRAGLLLVDDAPVTFDPEKVQVRMHNSQDRFTGGVRQQALFSEELLYEPTFSVRIWLTDRAEFNKLDPALKAALNDALSDLCDGLLPLGAGSGRGTSLTRLNSEVEAPAHFDALLGRENL